MVRGAPRAAWEPQGEHLSSDWRPGNSPSFWGHTGGPSVLMLRLGPSLGPVSGSSQLGGQNLLGAPGGRLAVQHPTWLPLAFSHCCLARNWTGDMPNSWGHSVEELTAALEPPHHPFQFLSHGNLSPFPKHRHVGGVRGQKVGLQIILGRTSQLSLHLSGDFFKPSFLVFGFLSLISVSNSFAVRKGEVVICC